jgi:gas vesicle protein
MKMIRKVVIGSTLALASAALLPVVRNTLRPLVESGARGVKSTFETIKEEVEDIIVEAKIDRMQKQFEKELSYVEDDITDEQEVIEAAAEQAQDEVEEIKHDA